MTPRTDDAEALALAKRIVNLCGRPDVGAMGKALVPGTDVSYVSAVKVALEGALSAAYQRGQEEMRERAACCVPHYEFRPKKVRKDIRALPLTQEGAAPLITDHIFVPHRVEGGGGPDTCAHPTPCGEPEAMHARTRGEKE